MCSVTKLQKEAVVEKLVGGENLQNDIVPELSNTIKVSGLKSASFTTKNYLVWFDCEKQKKQNQKH